MTMRLFAIAICIVLAGCTDADWDNALSFLPMEHGSQSSASGVQPGEQNTMMAPAVVEGSQNGSTTVAQTDDAHCHAVASQRASDSSYMGMDEDQQKQEYDQTYANCVAWDKAHGYAR